jgi:hypothetical protein
MLTTAALSIIASSARVTNSSPARGMSRLIPDDLVP